METHLLNPELHLVVDIDSPRLLQLLYDFLNPLLYCLSAPHLRLGILRVLLHLTIDVRHCDILRRGRRLCVGLTVLACGLSVSLLLRRNERRDPCLAKVVIFFLQDVSKGLSIDEVLLKTVRFTGDFRSVANAVFERMGIVKDMELETVDLAQIVRACQGVRCA